jgi:lipopolysaccharide/colanic/teichoic acid biosynthesis glycosyltransferase
LNPFIAQNLPDRTLLRFGPPLVAAGFIIWLTNRLSTAAVAFVAILFVDAVLRTGRYPLRLVPFAHRVLAIGTVGAGLVVAYAFGHISSQPIYLGETVLAFTSASLVTIAAIWVGDRLAAEHPIRTAVIGDLGFTHRLKAELDENHIRSYELVGYIGEDRGLNQMNPDAALLRLGAISEVRRLVQENQIDLLVVDPAAPRLLIFGEVAAACLDLKVRMIEATALYERVLGHVPIGVINAAWFQYIMHPLYSPNSSLSKRLLDIAVSAAMLLVLSPILLLSILAVKLSDGGPILFRQRRIGEEGREFDMIKFRTLVVDADVRMGEGVTEEELITPVGKLLRKVHLNEFPQLFQVLRGEMSLVGPRPEPPALVRELGDTVPHYNRRALVKPGLTGWAQVRCGYAGSRIGTAWKTCHDLYYLKHRSVTLDLITMLETVPALIERHESDEQVPAPDFILGDAADVVVR